MDGFEFNLDLTRSSFYGNITEVKKAIDNGATSFNWALSKAVINGDKNIIELLIKHGANNFNLAMENAADRGDMDIINIMIKNGANSFDNSLLIAEMNGFIDIIKIMIENGADFNLLTDKYIIKKVEELFKNEFENLKYVLYEITGDNSLAYILSSDLVYFDQLKKIKIK